MVSDAQQSQQIKTDAIFEDGQPPHTTTTTVPSQSRVTLPEPDAAAVPSAWQARAKELAAWTWKHLVNRTDVCGAYGSKGPVTWPERPEDRGLALLTVEMLERHFAATGRQRVLGLHAISQGDTSLWGGMDIDAHGERTAEEKAANWRAAKGWYDRLTELGFNPLLTDSNGKGGYHLRIVFEKPVPTAGLFDFLQHHAADFKSFGLAKIPETFPKQAGVTKDAPCGNWMRLPGRHHTEPHWSRVWDGKDWLEGAEAVEYILTLTPDNPALIGDWLERSRPSGSSERPPVKPLAASAYRESEHDVPAWLIEKYSVEERVRRAEAYIRSMSYSISGERGHDAFFAVVRKILKGFCVPEKRARELINWYNGNRCQPAWSDKEVEHKIRQVLEKANEPAGWALIGRPPEESRANDPKRPEERPLEEWDLSELAHQHGGEEIDYLPLLGQEGYLVRKWSHLLAAFPRVGKTELLAAACRYWIEAGESVVYFTEEPRSLWVNRGAQHPNAWSRMKVVPGLGVKPDRLLKRAIEGDQTIVIADTIRALGILGEDANDPIKVTDALSPWIAGLRQAEKTFFAAAHCRKGGGEGGEAIANSHAIFSLFDVALEMKRDDHQSNRRILTMFARIIEREPFAIVRNTNGDMMIVGNAAQFDLEAVCNRILSCLAAEWATTTEIYKSFEEPKPHRRTVANALSKMFKERKVLRDPLEGETVGKRVRWKKA
jgi:hypothetical protein